MYKKIRPIAFQFLDDIGDLTVEYYALKFPELWKYNLKKVYADSKNRHVDKTSLPHKDLNKAIRALVPDVVSIHRNLGWRDSPWVRSSSAAASSQAMRIILQQWARKSLKSVKSETLRPVLAQLTPDMLQWQKESVSLTDWTINLNGTAQKTDESQFTILPDYIASILAQPDVIFVLKEQSFGFLRIPIAPGDSGAELMSWPPQEALFGKGSKAKFHYYSILVRITVQTVPFDPKPYIYIDLGVRRWVSVENTKIPGGNTSVYVKSSVPWIEGINQLPSFQVASIRWVNTGKQDPELVWGNYLVDILNQLNPKLTFPTPIQLVANPTDYLARDAELNAGIVYRNGIKPNHMVGAGLMPGDRKPLIEQIARRLASQFQLVDTYKRTDKSPRPKNRFTEDRETAREKMREENLLEERHEVIQECVGNKVSFEIYYQKDETKAEFIKQLEEMLGITILNTLPVELQPSGVTILVDAKPIGKLADKLVIDKDVSNKTDRIYRSIDQRAKQIESTLEVADIPTICFVEIAEKKAFDNEEDPKKAIRHGFAKTGRLTQFINRDSESSLKDRVKKCLLDGFRQLGVNQLAFNQGILPVEANYVGLWLIYLSKDRNPAGVNRYIPVFTLIEPSTFEVLARVPGIDRWLPYRDLLIEINSTEKVIGFDRRNKALPFIQQVIETELVAEDRTILMCLAQNMRSAWSWLQDQHIILDKITFGDEKPRSIQDFKGLRIVRIRSSQNHETPEWYAVDEDDEKYGFSKGLFAAGNRRFASTYGKSAQFKNIAKSDSIFTRPQAPAWNPGMFEVIVAAMQSGDNSNDLAATVHRLRNLSLQYDDATAMPLPLHLASLIEEYILFLNYSEDD